MINLFSDTVDLAELICQSDEVKNYLRLKNQVYVDSEAKKLIVGFKKIKDLYEEAQRFGRFHPNYHEAKKEAQYYQKEMYTYPLIRAYMESEKELDKLLYDVSCILAHSVSDEVMVPNDSWNRTSRGCKCKG